MVYQAKRNGLPSETKYSLLDRWLTFECLPTQVLAFDSEIYSNPSGHQKWKRQTQILQGQNVCQKHNFLMLHD